MAKQLKSQSQVAETCAGKAKNGRCRARPMGGRRFSFFHDPELGDECTRARRRGAAVTNGLAITPLAFKIPSNLRSIADLMELVETILRATIGNDVDHKVANALGNLVKLQVSLLDDFRLEERLVALETAFVEGGHQMRRKNLADRLAALESRNIPPTALSFEEAGRHTIGPRAQGNSEREVCDALDEQDPSLMRSGFFVPSEYASYDQTTIRFPGEWAARHVNPYVAIVGRLNDGGFSVLMPGGERFPLRSPEGFDSRVLDHLAVFWLGLLAQITETWSTFWSRSAGVRGRIGLASFCIESAKKRAKTMEAEEDAEELADYRAALGVRIEWILGHHKEPDSIPWVVESTEAQMETSS